MGWGRVVGLGVRVDVNEKKNWGGGVRRVRLGGQDGCERRIEVFVKIQKKKKINGGDQGGCEIRIEVLVKIQ